MKRILALLITAVLLLVSMAVPVAGEEAPGVRVGDIITFGHYPQTAEGTDETPIEWLVLDMRDGNVLLFSRYGLDCQPYNSKKVNTTWEECSLRAWLNEEFLNKAFNSQEREQILEIEVDNSALQDLSEWRSKGSNNTRDRIYLLSAAEASRYFGVRYATSKNMYSRTSATDYALHAGAFTNEEYTTSDGSLSVSWCLRSPGGNPQTAARVDNDGGFMSFYVEGTSGCIRPVLWIPAAAADRLPRRGAAAEEPYDGGWRCPDCGRLNYDLYCPECGRENPDPSCVYQAGSALPASERTSGSFGCMMLHELTGKYGKNFRPANSQSFNAYMVYSGKEIGVFNEGIVDAKKTSIPSDVRSYMRSNASQIEQQSGGLIRFVDDPDKAELFVYVDFEYSEISGKTYLVNGYPMIGSRLTAKISFTSMDSSRYFFYVSDTTEPGSGGYTSHLGGFDLWMDPPDFSSRWETGMPGLIRNCAAWLGNPERIQRALLSRGYLKGTATEKSDERMLTAVRYVQEEYGLPANGYLSLSTQLAASYDKETVEQYKDWDTVTEDPEEIYAACPGCGWIYTFREAHPYCMHCGHSLAGAFITDDYITFGHYPQDDPNGFTRQPIVWRILEKREDRMFLLSRDVLDLQKYASDKKTVTWGKSSVRTWLNESFLMNAFSPEERSSIRSVSLEHPKTEKRKNEETTKDRIFLLSPEEITEDYKDARLSAATGYAKEFGMNSELRRGDDDYWLRYSYAVQNSDSTFAEIIQPSPMSYRGIRPAMWISIDTATGMLTPAEHPAHIIQDNVRVLKEAKEKAGKLAVLKRDQAVTVLDTEGDWCLISVNTGKKVIDGYVPREALEFDNP